MFFYNNLYKTKKGCFASGHLFDLHDDFKYQPHVVEDDKHQTVSRCVSLFKANSAHVGPNFSGRSMQSLGQVREALDVWSTMIKDVDVLVFFMIYSRPYSKHLLLDNCLFGRQVETECICPQFPVAHTFLWCWRTGGPAYCWSWQSR